jgi:hypothetical protein
MYFNTIYTCGIFANNISCFFTGALLDKYGPKYTSILQRREERERRRFFLFIC